MMIERVPSQFQYKQANILVVDDETSLLPLRHTVFERKGHEVVLAESGERRADRRESTSSLGRARSLPFWTFNGLKVLSRLRAIDPPGLRDHDDGIRNGRNDGESSLVWADEIVK